jgi:hypothetical protein
LRTKEHELRNSSEKDGGGEFNCNILSTFL